MAVTIAAFILALTGVRDVRARPVQHGCYMPGWVLGRPFDIWVDHNNDPNNQYHDTWCMAHTPGPETATPTVTATGTATPTRTPRPPSRVNTPRPASSATPTATPTITPTATATPTSTPTATAAPSVTATITPTATPPTTGTSAPSLSVPVLNAEAIEGGVALSWNAVPGATRYELWAWTEPGGWQRLGGNNLAASSYDHTMLMAGTVYYYVIRAEDSGGHVSGWSPYLAAAVPASPASETALAVPMLIAAPAEGRVEIGWSTVTGAVRYELWAWWDAETGWRQLGDVNLTGNAYTHSGLTPDTTYWYVVRAVDAGGATSAWSEHIPATVPAS